MAKPRKEEQPIEAPRQVLLVEMRAENIGPWAEKIVPIRPRGVTTVAGSNGVGKSTVIKMLTALRDGIDADMVRRANGEESNQAEITWKLSDESEITRSRIGGKADVGVVVPGIGDLKKSKEYIEALIDSVAMNPLKLLTAKPEDQLTALLEAVKLELSPDEIADALGVDPKSMEVRDAVARSQRTNAIEVIDGKCADIFAARTTLNRDADQKKKHAAELKDALGPIDPTDWQAEYEKVAAHVGALAQEISAIEENARKVLAGEIKLADQQHDQTIANAKTVLESALATIEDEYKAAVALAEANRKQKRGEAQNAYSTTTSEAMVMAQTAKSEARDRCATLIAEQNGSKRDEHSAASTEAGAAKEKALSQFQQTLRRKDLDRAREEHRKLQAESDALTNTLGRLKTLRANLVRRLPFDGIDVENGRLTLHGIPFNQQNTATRVRFVLELAVMRLGPLRAIAADNIEALDGETFAALRDAAEAMEPPLQILVARVEGAEGEFRPLAIAS